MSSKQRCQYRYVPVLEDSARASSTLRVELPKPIVDSWFLSNRDRRAQYERKSGILSLTLLISAIHNPVDLMRT